MPSNRTLQPHLSRAHTALGWFCAVGLLTAAGLLIGQPDQRDALRAIDRLFVAGHYHAALRAYQAIDSADMPEAALRLGMLRTLRGEHGAAERALRTAMQGGLSSADYHLALLYLGQSLADAGRPALAARTLGLLADCRSPAACAYSGPGQILVAEQALRQGDYPAAEASYRVALSASLPTGWAELASYRLALLRAARDPAAALAELASPARGRADEPLLAPLLPQVGTGSDQLAAVLAAPHGRAQLLGQLYLDLGIYGLAEAQFAQIDPRGPDAMAAAAYAAYTRWQAGDRVGGLDRLEELVRAHPAAPRPRTLLALAYLAADASASAREQIDAVAQLSPNTPDVQLAWASWYAARREYAEASLAYGQALVQAPRAERGRYALLGARFHLATTYELCESGLPMAELAVAALPDDPAANTALAANRYRCGQYGPAVEAATHAIEAGGGPDSAYYLGAALAALGEREGARVELIRAADLAPASIWRERAERALAALP